MSQISFFWTEGSPLGCLGGSAVECLPLAQFRILVSWDQVPHWFPCRERTSSSSYVSAPVSVSLMNKKNLRERETFSFNPKFLDVIRFFGLNDISRSLSFLFYFLFLIAHHSGRNVNSIITRVYRSHFAVRSFSARFLLRQCVPWEWICFSLFLSNPSIPLPSTQ